jgi:hypothetical protein
MSNFKNQENYTLFHYEKLCLSKPHYFVTKTQKTTHIQLLCNYPLRNMGN